MSDSWYRDPLALPPYEDGLGRGWNFDGSLAYGEPDEPFDDLTLDLLPTLLRIEASFIYRDHLRALLVDDLLVDELLGGHQAAP